MEHQIEVADSRVYYTSEPDRPKHGDLWANIDGDYVKVVIFDGKEWYDVTDMKAVEDTSCVIVKYDDTDDEPEDIEMMEYYYRLGVS